MSRTPYKLAEGRADPPSRGHLHAGQGAAVPAHHARVAAVRHKDRPVREHRQAGGHVELVQFRALALASRYDLPKGT